MHRTGAVRRGIEPAWCETTRPVAESPIKSSHCKKDALARRLQQSTQLPAGQPAMSIENIEKLIADHRVEFVDLDRKSVVSGKSVSVRVDIGGRRIIQKKKTKSKIQKD